MIRRDFVIKNDLHFTDNLIQDQIFTCCLLFAQAKFVRVPYIVNLYRLVDDSLSHKTETPEDYLKKYLRTLRTGFEYMDNFLSARPFFQQHTEIKFVALDICVQECLGYFTKAYGQIPLHVFEEIYRRELTSENFSPALTAAILNRANIFRFKLAQQRIAELENEIRQLKSKE